MFKTLIFGDLHLPYHDPEALELLIKVIRSVKPQTIISLGDILDFYAVSSHRKDPMRKAGLVHELMAARKDWKRLARACKDAHFRIFLGGNHEARLAKYLVDHAPALTGLPGLTVADILELPKLGWDAIPYQRAVTLGDVLYTHDLGGTGPYCAQQALRSAGQSVVIGHTHRITSCAGGTVREGLRVAHSFGWLGDVDTIDYMHRVKVQRDWAHGFGIGYFDTKLNRTHLEAVPIVDKACVVSGKLYQL